MRLYIHYLLIFFCFKFCFSQKTDDLRIIDSIQIDISRSKFTDSTNLANAHYRIGELFRYNFLGDSAYFHYNKAEKIYRSKKNKIRIARTLYGIAVVQCNEKDFTGCEVTSVEAISILESLKETNEVIKYKSYIYNNLGLAFGQLGQYDVSISYYDTALKLKNKIEGDNKATIDNTRNNLALSYKKSGRFNLAATKYKEILLNKDLKNQRPDFFALVLDNYAHTLYLANKRNDLPELYFKALKITDSVNPGGYNSIIINQHLAEYYNDLSLKDSAKYFGYNAKKIAQKFHNEDYLVSLLLLAEIEDGKESAKHLKEYIELNDSLQKVERATRNKFARIRFETDQLEEENIKIAKERMWLLIISTVLIITFFLLYLVIRQRVKNKELEFVQKQQETNEEIYNLMLSQSDTIEEARTLEKKRISEELHDGVLGRLFGTRLSLDSLNFNNTPEAVKTRGEYIDSLKNIEEDIRKVSHELNTDFIAGAGFRDIIKTLVETQSSAYKLKHSLDHDDSINWDLFSNKTKIHIYRIIQESLHNIYKHAKASSVNIGFKPKNNVICLQVQDNGVGFDVNKAKSGIGLKNMKSRINEINGEFNLSSSKQEGTIVSIEIPLA